MLIIIPNSRAAGGSCPGQRGARQSGKGHARGITVALWATDLPAAPVTNTTDSHR